MSRTLKILGIAGGFTLLTAGAAFAADQAMKCCECCDKMAERGGMDHDMPMPAPVLAPEPQPAPPAN